MAMVPLVRSGSRLAVLARAAWAPVSPTAGAPTWDPAAPAGFRRRQWSPKFMGTLWNRTATCGYRSRKQERTTSAGEAAAVVGSRVW